MNPSWRSTLLGNTIVASCVLAVLPGCSSDSDVNEAAYSWVNVGNSFDYDYAPGDPSSYSELPDKDQYPATSRGLRLEVNEHIGDRVSLQWSYPKWTRIPGAIGASAVIGDMNVSVSAEGLYDSTYRSCVPGGLFTISFLRAPSNPKVGQTFEDLLCEGTSLRKLFVTAVNVLVDTPAGQFNAFVIEGDDGRGREYWAPETGIVKIERLDDQGRVVGEYLLATITSSK